VKITVNRELLARAVATIDKAVPAKSPLDMATSIRMFAFQNNLYLEGSAPQYTMRVTIAGTTTDGEDIIVAYVNSRRLKEFTSALKGDAVAIVFTDNSIKISCDKVKATIKAIVGDERADGLFEAVRPISADGVTVPASGLLRALKRVVIAACTNNSSAPFLNGVSFQKKDRPFLSFMATDSFRMGRDLIPYDGPETNIIVPTEAVTHLCNELSRSPGDNPVIVKSAKSRATFTYKLEDLEIEIASKLIAFAFPDLESLVPSSCTSSVKLNRQELVNAVAPVLAVSNYETIKVQITDGKFYITAENQDGLVTSESDAEITGEEIEIMMYAKYLLETLKSNDSETVTMELNGPRKPILLKADNAPDYVSVVMPRIK